MTFPTRSLIFAASLTLTLVIHALPSMAEDAPRLFINHNGHSDLVSDIVFTPTGRQLISVGKDKSIRIWNTETGKLDRTIRTEIGDATDGKHYCAALSSDGRWLAVAGWATSKNDDYGAIRVIDLRDDSMAAVLRGHTNVVSSLAFSGDGSVLVSSGSDKTARVWNTSGWTGQSSEAEAVHVNNSMTLQGHSDRVDDVVVTEDGSTVITGSFDKSVRIWKRSDSGRSYSVKSVLKGHSAIITSLASNADGSVIVSGDNNGIVLLWDGIAGKLRSTLDDTLQFKVNTLSISPDEKKVLASSKTGDGGTTATYSIESAKRLQSYDHHNNTVTASAWHPQKPIIVTAGSTNNEILLYLEKDGTILHQLVGNGLTFWGLGIRTEKAVEIALGVIPAEPGTGDPVGVQSAFDFLSQQVRAITDSNDSQRFIGLDVTFGEHGIAGNGDQITIGSLGKISHEKDSYDQFRVATATSDGKGILVGSTYFLRRYEFKNGKFVIATEFTGHEGGTLMIAESADGNYVVSSSLDQTVRLWNAKTGDLLVSLAANMNNEWVCWTPDGYFDASDNGGKLIGWHINRGLEKVSEHVSSDQLYDHFFRPDIVKKTVKENRPSAGIVRGLGIKFDLKTAINTAPGVELIGPADNSNSSKQRITVHVEGIDNGSGIAELRLFHEGKLLTADGPGTLRNGRFQVPYTLSLLSGKNELYAVALSPSGVESKPKTINVEFEGSKASARLFLLAVGINDYKNPRLNLNYCRPDVDAFADAFEKRADKLFTGIFVHKLYDADATGEAISAKLKEIAAVATPDDVFVFAFAGHGVMSEGGEDRDPQYYLVTHDVTQAYGNDEMLAEKALSGDQLRELSALIPARKQLMVLDACQSGGIVDSFAARGAQEERALAQLARSSGTYLLSSTRSEQFAMETKKLGHGLFTYAFLEALEGKGDSNSDGKITIKEVEAWLNERVPELSEEHVGSAQYPTSFARGQDFPIGIID